MKLTALAVATLLLSFLVLAVPVLRVAGSAEGSLRQVLGRLLLQWTPLVLVAAMLGCESSGAGFACAGGARPTSAVILAVAGFLQGGATAVVLAGHPSSVGRKAAWCLLSAGAAVACAAIGLGAAR